MNSLVFQNNKFQSDKFDKKTNEIVIINFMSDNYHLIYI